MQATNRGPYAQVFGEGLDLCGLMIKLKTFWPETKCKQTEREVIKEVVFFIKKRSH